MRDEWASALVGESNSHYHFHDHHHHATSQPSTTPKVFTDENGIRFEVDSGRAASDVQPIGQMKNAKWVAYAARALVIRFWDLAKVCPPLNVIY